MKDRPRALAVLIAVFLVGCIVGTAGSYFWFHWRQEPVIRTTENWRSRRPPEPLRLHELLQLDAQQTARYREIMAEMRQELEQLRVEQAPKLEAIRSETNRKLVAILNEEQQKKFDNFVKEMESFRMHSPGRRGGDHPPRP